MKELTQEETARLAELREKETLTTEEQTELTELEEKEELPEAK